MLIASEEIVTEMIVIVMNVKMTVLTGEVTGWMIVVATAMGEQEEMNRAVTSGGGNHHLHAQKVGFICFVSVLNCHVENGSFSFDFTHFDFVTQSLTNDELVRSAK